MNLLRLAKRLVAGDPEFQPREAYSQDGEDLILDRLMDGRPSGFYVDIGAHHPVRFSNTHLFYRRGWRGINVDAQPGSMITFRRVRPRDINLEIGVGSEPGRASYFRFNEPALNTFDPDEARRKSAPPYSLLEVVDLQVRRLDDILSEHLPLGLGIDFLSVDVEGRDLDVLRSNDWTRYRPRYVLAETLRTDLFALQYSEITRFMAQVGYAPIAKAYNTTFFEASDRS